MGEMIMHHVLDDYRYEIMHGVIIPLPIIVYTDSGLEIFSSSNLFDEDHNALKEGYNGFKYDHGKLKPINPELSYIDLSITKNVAFLIMTSILMIIIFVTVARGYSNTNIIIIKIDVIIKNATFLVIDKSMYESSGLIGFNLP
jgi:F-type H+-transporting ATPase subunit a